MSKVVSLHGGPTGERTPSQECIEALTDLLEQAKSGEVVGFAGVTMHYDGTTVTQYGGNIGGYTMVGSLEAVKVNVLHIANGE